MNSLQNSSCFKSIIKHFRPKFLEDGDYIVSWNKNWGCNWVFFIVKNMFKVGLIYLDHGHWVHDRGTMILDKGRDHTSESSFLLRSKILHVQFLSQNPLRYYPKSLSG